VTVGSSVYTASIGSPIIYRYTNGIWLALSAYAGINQLAATDAYLYAILENNILYQINPGTDAGTPVNISGSLFQSVYGAGKRVFVGAGPGAGPYILLCYDETTSGPVSLTGITGLLKGAVWDGTNYFIATTGLGGGLYRIDSSNKITLLVSGNVMGVIRVEKYIIAITNDGMLYYFPHASVPTAGNVPFYLLGETYSGAMCSWRSYSNGIWGPSPSLLLLGIRSTSSTHGYREVILNTSAGYEGQPIGGAVIPGSISPSSVQSRPKYESSIGKHAVFSILQVPDIVQSTPTWQPVIFASTTKDGLWSLRLDQWNAEE
jgi:hypothetical protein